MAQPIIHLIKDGFCTQCGDTEAWLVENGHQVKPLEDRPELGATVRIGKGTKNWKVKGYDVAGGAGAHGWVHLTSHDNKGTWIDNRHVHQSRIHAV